MLLGLTTILRRLIVLVILSLVWTPAAYAWSWPVQGSVLQPFSYDESDPYAAAQHRGIDIAAEATGETVVAPADGTVSFAGTVPANGTTMTIETPDGYSVTLTHLGSLTVVKGATVAEGDAVATIGPSGTPETDGPYVHLGIRVTADPNGYVDPLSLLPPPIETSGNSDGSSSSMTQPVATGGASSSAPAPATQPAPVAAASAPAVGQPGTIARAQPGGVSHSERSQKIQADTRPHRISQEPPVSTNEAGAADRASPRGAASADERAGERLTAAGGRGGGSQGVVRPRRRPRGPARACPATRGATAASVLVRAPLAGLQRYGRVGRDGCSGRRCAS